MDGGNGCVEFVVCKFIKPVRYVCGHRQRLANGAVKNMGSSSNRHLGVWVVNQLFKLFNCLWSGSAGNRRNVSNRRLFVGFGQCANPFKFTLHYNVLDYLMLENVSRGTV